MDWIVCLSLVRGAQQRGRLLVAEASRKFPRVVRDSALRVHGGGYGDGPGDVAQRHRSGLNDRGHQLAR